MRETKTYELNDLFDRCLGGQREFRGLDNGRNDICAKVNVILASKISNAPSLRFDFGMATLLSTIQECSSGIWRSLRVVASARGS